MSVRHEEHAERRLALADDDLTPLNDEGPQKAGDPLGIMGAQTREERNPGDQRARLQGMLRLELTSEAARQNAGTAAAYGPEARWPAP